MRYQLVMSFFAAVVVFWSLYIIHNIGAAMDSRSRESKPRFLRTAGILIFVAVAAATASVAHWQRCASLTPSVLADTWYCG
jgi:hypothetical protein